MHLTNDIDPYSLRFFKSPTGVKTQTIKAGLVNVYCFFLILAVREAQVGVPCSPLRTRHSSRIVLLTDSRTSNISITLTSLRRSQESGVGPNLYLCPVHDALS